jgi:hypothetical protein
MSCRAMNYARSSSFERLLPLLEAARLLGMRWKAFLEINRHRLGDCRDLRAELWNCPVLLERAEKNSRQMGSNAPESNAFRWCASACAIGYLLALIPAASFVVVIHRRVCLEDSFLKVNLPGYNLYAQRVAAGFPFSRSF